MIENHNFRNLCKEILTLTYGFSDFNGTLHEDNMKSLMDSVGIINKSIDYRETKQLLLNSLRDNTSGIDISIMGFENGTYIHQPYGTHAAPDFILFINDTYLMIELKSSKSDGIVWNTHTPRKNWIYLFSCEKLKDTTYFMGQNMVSDEFRQTIDHINFEIEQLRMKTKLKCDSEDNKHGFTDYIRPMKMQVNGIGGGETRFIKSPYRKEYERCVSTFIKNIFRK